MSHWESRQQRYVQSGPAGLAGPAGRLPLAGLGHPPVRLPLAVLGGPGLQLPLAGLGNPALQLPLAGLAGPAGPRVLPVWTEKTPSRPPPDRPRSNPPAR